MSDYSEGEEDDIRLKLRELSQKHDEAMATPESLKGGCNKSYVHVPRERHISPFTGDIEKDGITVDEFIDEATGWYEPSSIRGKMEIDDGTSNWGDPSAYCMSVNLWDRDNSQNHTGTSKNGSSHSITGQNNNSNHHQHHSQGPTQNHVNGNRELHCDQNGRICDLLKSHCDPNF